jgi:2-(1,2-epoxy-1,2-dihydrophenyl)acetyl-CoA isomerase
MVDLALCQMREDIAVTTMNDPEKMNPLSDEMRARLLEFIEAMMAESAVRGIVITGAGGNFSAGSDIWQLIAPGLPDLSRSRSRLIPLHRLIELIAGGPKPVITAVEGGAFGAGLSIAAASDFVIAGDNARFGAGFGKIGLTADCGLVWSLRNTSGGGARAASAVTVIGPNTRDGHQAARDIFGLGTSGDLLIEQLHLLIKHRNHARQHLEH